MKEVIVASPRGFCAGVVRAVELCEAALEKYGGPVYLVHQLVHNDDVCRELEGKGAVFVDSLQEIPPGGVVVFSAHGSPPTAYQVARERGLTVVDATCPLVTRVHNEVKKYAGEGRTILVVGHPDHVEVGGTAGHSLHENARTLIINPDDLDTELLDEVAKVVQDVAVVTQTTLSQNDVAPGVKEILKRFPSAVIRDDICYATGNRQKAVQELFKDCGVILVIGSHESSNSRRLRETAERDDCPAYLIPNAEAAPWFWIRPANRVGVTSGASTPAYLVEEVVAHLVSLGYTRQDRSIPEALDEENIRFRDGVLP